MSPSSAHVAPWRQEQIINSPSNSNSTSSSNSAVQFTPEEEISLESELDLNEDDEDVEESFQMRGNRSGGKNAEDEIKTGKYPYLDKSISGKKTKKTRRTTNNHMTQSYTPAEEQAVIRKLDRRLVLFVAFLYMLSFLDRSNIGNARIAGLQDDLQLSSDQYAWVLTSFYLTYIAFEWMSLLWKTIPAHIYVCAIVLSWGITASLQSCVTSFAGLITLRILLGIGEAGFSGIVYYLSFFFKREEMALRTGFFISAAPLATSFASTLAWIIVRLGESSPIAPWRMLFLVEGFPSVIVAVVAFRFIPDGPGTAKFLTKREKRIAVSRLGKQRDSMKHSDNTKKGFNLSQVMSTLMDPKTVMTSLMFFFTNMSFASMPVFLPTIIQEMGEGQYSTLTAQALSAPPYLLSFVIVIGTAYLSDRTRTRAPYIIFHALLSATGYILLSLSSPLALGLWTRYFLIYPAAIGFFSVITIIITWNINNNENETKQGVAFAVMQVVGQCGPLVGTRLYPSEEGPFYKKGLGVCGGCMVMVAVLAAGLRGYLKRRNRTLKMGPAGGRYDAVREGDEDDDGKQTEDDDGALGAAEVEFRYML